jgi:L-amino acid N-acyltransferase YncA
MSEADFIIRPVADDDLEAVRAIYAHHVRTSTGTFEITAPDRAEMARRRTEVAGRGLPFLVAEAKGTVLGYAYANLYRTREAYRFTVEDSVYVAPDWLRQGLGGLLLGRLIDASAKAGARQMVAVIGGSDNRGSIRLHEGLGFVRVGLLTAAGFKFGRWCDSVLMQRPLGDGDSTLPP